MTGNLSPESAEEVARRVAEIAEVLPEGAGLVAFLIVDMGTTWESGLVATLPPTIFAPVLRRWLERYDAGEAEPEQPGGRVQ